MKKISELEKAQCAEQIAMMLDGGISLADGFDMLASQVDDAEYKDALLKISNDLNENISLSKSLEDSGLFDPYMVHMVEVGETSGYLDKVMSQLAIYYHRNNETRQKIKDAVTYPFILILMMLVVIIALITKILPLFNRVLQNLGVSLSSTSLLLMNVGKWCAYVVLVLLILVVLCLIYCFITTRQKTYSMIHLLEQFVVTKKISYSLALAQFAYCLSLLIGSGFNQSDAFKMCVEMCENKELKPKIEKIANEVDTTSLQELLLKYPVFANSYNRLLVIGIKSGHFDEAIKQVASSYEKEVDYSIENFLNMIEPILVTVMSIIVGVILLAVMLPLTSIMSSL